MRTAALLLVATLIAIACFGAYSISGGMVAKDTAMVERVIDGDTLKLSSGERVRLLNIDTPEVGQYYHDEAAERLRQLVEGKEVVLEPDVTNRDKYGRLLRYVYVNGEMAELAMVREGYARSYYIEPDGRHLQGILEAESEARAEGLGIWQFDNITGAFCVWVYDFKYDSEGDDRENVNGEYFVLRNSCAYAVDMSGWSASDRQGNAFMFPSFMLGSKELVSVHSGKGQDNATDLYWGSTAPIWGNGGDALKLYNSDGIMALDYGYGGG